jgi:hypothetical protein
VTLSNLWNTYLAQSGMHDPAGSFMALQRARPMTLEVMTDLAMNGAKGDVKPWLTSRLDLMLADHGPALAGVDAGEYAAKVKQFGQEIVSGDILASTPGQSFRDLMQRTPVAAELSGPMARMGLTVNNVDSKVLGAAFWSENYSRFQNYIALRLQGMPQAEARRSLMQGHIDYTGSLQPDLVQAWRKYFLFTTYPAERIRQLPNLLANNPELVYSSLMAPQHVQQAYQGTGPRQGQESPEASYLVAKIIRANPKTAYLAGPEYQPVSWSVFPDNAQPVQSGRGRMEVAFAPVPAVPWQLMTQAENLMKNPLDAISMHLMPVAQAALRGTGAVIQGIPFARGVSQSTPQSYAQQRIDARNRMGNLMGMPPIPALQPDSALSQQSAASDSAYRAIKGGPDTGFKGWIEREDPFNPLTYLGATRAGLDLRDPSCTDVDLSLLYKYAQTPGLKSQAMQEMLRRRKYGNPQQQ